MVFPIDDVPPRLSPTAGESAANGFSRRDPGAVVPGEVHCLRRAANSIDMSASVDTLSTARDLEAAGFEREKAEAIASAVGHSNERAATKSDLEPLATKAELIPLATRKDLESLATKAELVPLATKAELEPLATKAELEPFGAVCHQG